MKVERIIQLSGENFNFSYDILFKLQVLVYRLVPYTPFYAKK